MSIEEDPFKTLTLSGSDSSKNASLLKDDPIFSHIPEKIGSYKVKYILEKSRGKLLYLGIDEKNAHPVVIKVLFLKYAPKQEIIDQFLQEARIISLADHPNIVSLYDQGVWENGLYIAMEFIEGVSLRQYILKRPVSLKKALELIIDIAYAICHLHTHGIIHRDVKPDNILITEKEKVKVIDFGISRLMEETVLALKEKKVAGTPFYMSPEQKDNPQNVSYPSDIYSLAIVAYELILGKLAYGKIHLSLLPKGLRSIFSKAFQTDVQNRYQDVVDFISDITAYMASESFQEDALSHDQATDLADAVESVTSNLLSDECSVSSLQDIALAHHTGMRTPSFFYDMHCENVSTHIHLIWPLTYSTKETLECLSMMGAVKAFQSQGFRGKELFDRVQKTFPPSTSFTNKSFLWVHLNPLQEKGEFLCTGSAKIFLFSSEEEQWSPLFLSGDKNQEIKTDPLSVTFTWEKENALTFLLLSEQDSFPTPFLSSSLFQAFSLAKKKPSLETAQLLLTNLKHQEKKLLQQNFLVGVAKRK